MLVDGSEHHRDRFALAESVVDGLLEARHARVVLGDRRTGSDGRLAIGRQLGSTGTLSVPREQRQHEQGDEEGDRITRRAGGNGTRERHL